MKKLKIAQLSTPFFDTPPQNYGGTEIAVSYLTEELVKRGHRVTLFATGNSKTKAQLEFFFQKALGLGQPKETLFEEAKKFPWLCSLPYFWHAALAFEKNKQFDVVHNHFHKHGLLFSLTTKTPVLTTVHGGTASTERQTLENLVLEKYKNNFFAAISQSQANSLKTKLKNLSVVHHGIPLEKFPFSDKPENYLLFLGKIAEKKGVLEAIETAKKTGDKLLIAGNVNPADQDFFQKEVKPKLDQKNIFYLGPVNHNQKVKAINKAKALLYPIKWQEPFGLVMIESMACGTPVVAFGKGAVPEIVKDRQTGFIVKNTSQMAQAIKNIKQINRSECRKWVEQNFSVQKMADNYEKLYYKIIRG